MRLLWLTVHSITFIAEAF
uniref:Uncharacterized protein n=1 Tax=Anguilla anguilla TaxID=7936 RepID=A0A0E9PLG4_ANGAN